MIKSEDHISESENDENVNNLVESIFEKKGTNKAKLIADDNSLIESKYENKDNTNLIESIYEEKNIIKDTKKSKFVDKHNLNNSSENNSEYNYAEFINKNKDKNKNNNDNNINDNDIILTTERNLIEKNEVSSKIENENNEYYEEEETLLDEPICATLV